MQLDYSILKHLSDNDNGKFVDITFILDDHKALNKKLEELRGKNMILVDENSVRDFELFGIGNDRRRSIKAKIKMNGRIYFHTLKARNEITGSNENKKNRWSLSYFF
ncbi:MAG: hypothetical protein GY908_06620 [Flavobacteriales bacterium]|nr:hypothetical protein [Flavobacteriales bacterium]